MGDPEPAAPHKTQGYNAFIDPKVPMSNVYDGWGSQTIHASLERQHGGKWTMQDVNAHELHQRFVSLPLGLVLQMNIDWYDSYYKCLQYH